MNKQRDPHALAKSLSDKIDELQTDVEDALLLTIGGESDEYRRAMRHVSCEFLRDLHHRVLDKIVQGTYSIKESEKSLGTESPTIQLHVKKES